MAPNTLFLHIQQLPKAESLVRYSTSAPTQNQEARETPRQTTATRPSRFVLVNLCYKGAQSPILIDGEHAQLVDMGTGVTARKVPFNSGGLTQV